MSAMASQITSLTTEYPTGYSRRRSKKTPKRRVTDLCERNSPVTIEFPAQSASNAENVSIWWRHHDISQSHTWLITLAWTQFYQSSNKCSRIQRFVDKTLFGLADVNCHDLKYIHTSMVKKIHILPTRIADEHIDVGMKWPLLADDILEYILLIFCCILCLRLWLTISHHWFILWLDVHQTSKPLPESILTNIFIVL